LCGNSPNVLFSNKVFILLMLRFVEDRGCRGSQWV
jgi:hypothetical protein